MRYVTLRPVRPCVGALVGGLHDSKASKSPMTRTCRYANVVGISTAVPERKDQLYAPSDRSVLRRQHAGLLEG
jgi:hypothetical protein